MEKAAADRAEENRKKRIRADVAQMNADVVGAKLQEFEGKLGAQDIRMAAMQGHINALEQRLNVQNQLAATAAIRGTGSTSGDG